MWWRAVMATGWKQVLAARWSRRLQSCARWYRTRARASPMPSQRCNNLKPAPDNIYLLTDGLPTQAKQAPGGVTPVKPAQRATFFNQAVRELPGRVPVNVLLYPMDGDPDAAGFFWRLAIATKGSFLTPSRDWP